MITITIRDINGKRNTIEFNSESDVLKWIEDEGISDEDEILIVTQGNLCLYSALWSIDALSIDDLTGFFG